MNIAKNVIVNLPKTSTS